MSNSIRDPNRLEQPKSKIHKRDFSPIHSPGWERAKSIGKSNPRESGVEGWAGGTSQVDSLLSKPFLPFWSCSLWKSQGLKGFLRKGKSFLAKGGSYGRAQQEIFQLNLQNSLFFGLFFTFCVPFLSLCPTFFIIIFPSISIFSFFLSIFSFFWDQLGMGCSKTARRYKKRQDHG